MDALVGVPGGESEQPTRSSTAFLDLMNCLAIPVPSATTFHFGNFKTGLVCHLKRHGCSFVGFNCTSPSESQPQCEATNTPLNHQNPLILSICTERKLCFPP